MVIRRFEDLIAWQKAQDLAVEIYVAFGDLKDYGFRDQICRAVVSVSNNIAEGFTRDSVLDINRFLTIAKGSSNEVKSMLHLAERLLYTSLEKRDSLLKQTEEVQKILSGLKKSITSKKKAGTHH